jgi:hypothetical protein
MIEDSTNYSDVKTPEMFPSVSTIEQINLTEDYKKSVDDRYNFVKIYGPLTKNWLSLTASEKHILKSASLFFNIYKNILLQEEGQVATFFNIIATFLYDCCFFICMLVHYLISDLFRIIFRPILILNPKNWLLRALVFLLLCYPSTWFLISIISVTPPIILLSPLLMIGVVVGYFICSIYPGEYKYDDLNILNYTFYDNECANFCYQRFISGLFKNEPILFVITSAFVTSILFVIGVKSIGSRNWIITRSLSLVFLFGKMGRVIYQWNNCYGECGCIKESIKTENKTFGLLSLICVTNGATGGMLTSSMLLIIQVMHIWYAPRVNNLSLSIIVRLGLSGGLLAAALGIGSSLIAEVTIWPYLQINLPLLILFCLSTSKLWKLLESELNNKTRILMMIMIIFIRIVDDVLLSVDRASMWYAFGNGPCDYGECLKWELWSQRQSIKQQTTVNIPAYY